MRHTQTPSTLTDAEVKALLQATGRAEADIRDHIILSIALGCGLRVSEIVGLNIGDVLNGKGVRGIWNLRPEITKGNKGGVIALPDRLRRKVSRYITYKRAIGESLEPNAPLFLSRGGGPASKKSGGRISVRTIQHMFHRWQKRSGFDRIHNFHALRHTYATALWRATGDLRLVQSAVRHSSPSTTAIYTHPTTDDILTAVQSITC